MKNNYIISIDLNKIYHSLNSDNQSEFDTNHNNNTNTNTVTNLKNLILSHYNLDSFDFTNDIEQFKDIFISKFDIDYNDLILLDKTIYLNSYQNKYNKFKSYDQGLILIDLSMLGDDLILSDIDYLYENYEHLSMNKIYDNYLLHFKNKLNTSRELADKKTQFNSKLYEIFYEDLLDLNLWQKIINIPNKINSMQMIKKLEEDLYYMKNIKQNAYEKYYSNINSKSDKELLLYEKSIYLDIKSDNYVVNYNLNDQLKSIDKNKFHFVLDKLNEYNTYINNIIVDLQKLYPTTSENQIHKSKLNRLNLMDFSHITNSDSDLENNVLTNKKQSNLLKIVDPNELFNYSKIINLYSFLKSKSDMSTTQYSFNMTDVFDNKLEINYLANPAKQISAEILSNDDFVNSTILFLNELIKRKMKKLLKTYNYVHNETNILNNIN
jgi:hypothetical protein